MNEATLTEWRNSFAQDGGAIWAAQEMPRILDSLQRLLAVKRAADPFIEYSHDPAYWQQFGTDAYENLKQAIFYCDHPERAAALPREAPARKPIVTKLEFLE